MMTIARDNDYYGYDCLKFVGIATECDPDMIRVRVRVFGIHNIDDRVKVSDGDLPWAIVSYPVDSSAPHTIVPGTWVHGFFMDGRNAQQPIIEGVFPRGFGGPLNGTDAFMGRPGTSGSNDGGSPDGPIAPTTSTITIPGNSNLDKTYNYIYNKLVAEKLSADPRMHTAAAVGAIMVESYDVDHIVAGAPDKDLSDKVGGGYKNRAVGIAQWLGDRRTTILNRYGSSPDLGQQLDYMWWELNHTETEARRRWLSANNLEDAVAGFEYFERNDAMIKGTTTVNRNSSIFKKAMRYAQQIYNTKEPQAYEVSDTPSRPADGFVQRPTGPQP